MFSVCFLQASRCLVLASPTPKLAMHVMGGGGGGGLPVYWLNKLWSFHRYWLPYGHFY